MNGANPTLAITESLPAHTDELRAERAKVVARLLEINRQITLAETLSMMVPDPLPPAEIPT